jgi:hypothetical protein
MNRSLWNGMFRLRRPVSPQRVHRWPSTRLSPACEAMEGRQLLSVPAPGLPATTLIPPAGEVANAAAALAADFSRDAP